MVFLPTPFNLLNQLINNHNYFYFSCTYNIIIFMIINIKDLKNKIIYRANYRGTKEMDKLLVHLLKNILIN